MEAAFGLIAVFVLVFINGFFVAAEFGLVGARKTRITQLASEGNAGAKSAQNAIEHLDSYIAATQLGITLASLGLGWIGEPALARLIIPVLEAVLPEDMVHSAGHTIAVIIAFSLVTTLHIVLGELAPKTIALQEPEKTSIIVARPTTLFLKFFGPIIYVMNAIGNLVVHLMGFESAGGHAHVHSVEELHMLVASSGEAGVLEKGEEELFHRVFDFGDTTVEEVMQPRVEVVGFPVNIALPDLVQRLQKLHYSRYPIYAESLDDVIGILHVSTLFELIVKKPELLARSDVDFDLKSLLMTPVFVPEKLPIDRLLERMQRAKTHQAVVIDEYGGMAGIATMEDILEELVGEVQDEFDDTEVTPIRVQGDVAIVDGLTSIGDVTERFGEPQGHVLSTTIGGYVAEKLGRIPSVGDKVLFGEYKVTVDEMDALRVSSVRFSKRLSGNKEY